MNKKLSTWAEAAASAASAAGSFVVARFQAAPQSSERDARVDAPAADPETAAPRAAHVDASPAATPCDDDGCNAPLSMAVLADELLALPGGDAIVLQVADLEEQRGEVTRSVDLRARLLQASDDRVTRFVRDEARTALHRILFRWAETIRANVDRALASDDAAAALHKLDEQIHGAGALLRVDAHIGDRAGMALSVVLNYAIAARAYRSWVDGHVDDAEKTVSMASADGELAHLECASTFTHQLWDTFTQLVAEEGRRLFENESWKKAAEAFRYARSKRLGVNRNEIDELTAGLYVREAMCEYNAHRYRRTQDLLTHLMRRAPGYRQQELTLLRDRARHADVAVQCQQMYRKAASAFRNGDWESAVSLYMETASFIEGHDSSEFRNIAAECHFNAAMSHWNRGDYRESRRILETLRTDFPDYDAKKVESRIVDAERALQAALGSQSG